MRGTPPAPVGAGPRTDPLAISAVVIGILSLLCSLLCLGIVLGPTAAIMGLVAYRRVASTATSLGGGRLAAAGLVLGIAGFVASAAWLTLLLRDPSFQQFLKAP